MYFFVFKMCDALSMELLNRQKDDPAFPPEWRECITSYKEKLEEGQDLEDKLKKNKEEREKLVFKILKMKRDHDRQHHGNGVPSSSGQRVQRGEFTNFSEVVNSLVKCLKCGKVFKSRDTFTTHFKNSHSDKKKKVYPCPTCGKPFTRTYNWTRHQGTCKGK